MPEQTQSVRRSISIVFVAKYLEHGLALVSGMILARWLTPEDFGIYSIAASVVMLGYLFRNFGVGQFIVQAKEVTDDILRSAFAVTLFISWSVGLLLLAIAPYLGNFYDEQGVTTVLRFLSLNFFLLPFGSITNALLRRDMRFEKLAVINVSSAATSLVVALTAAWFGASYLAIAWASNASTVVAIFITCLYRPKGLPWLPGFRRFREVLTFGFKVGAMDIFNNGSDSVTELVIGKANSLHDLGIYSRAYGTFKLFEFAFLQTIRQVVLPYLSRAKHESEDLGQIYLKMITLLSIFALPFFAFLGVNAREVIAILYGDQWGAATTILQIMCVAGCFYAPTLFFEQLMIANGRPGQATSMVMQSQTLRLLALLVLAWISLEAAAVALVVGLATRMILVLRLSSLHFQLSPASFFKAAATAIMTALVALAATSMSRAMLQQFDSEIILVLGSGVVMVIVWVTMVFLFQHPAARELQSLVARVRGA